jgi:hypothetical protein
VVVAVVALVTYTVLV